MKTVKMLGMVLAMLVMVGLNTDAFAGYSELTPDEQATATQAWILAGSVGTVEEYCLIRQSEQVAVAKEEIRQSRVNILFRKLFDATDAELEQVEAIFNP